MIRFCPKTSSSFVKAYSDAGFYWVSVFRMKLPFFSSRPVDGDNGAMGKRSPPTLEVLANTVPPVKSARPAGTPSAAGQRSTRQPPPRPLQASSMGAILVASGRITGEDAQRVLTSQLELGVPFGELAIQLGVATRDDVQFALAKQFSLPYLPAGSTAIDREVVAAFDHTNELLESVRNLRNQIVMRALTLEPPLRSIAILGIERGVGRSFIAANLAISFAQLGTRTLLIDADLKNPRQHSLFRLNNRGGLSSVLARRTGLEVVCPVPGLPGFAVLPAGPIPPNPHDLLARPILAQFLRRCEQDFRVILLDTPSWDEERNAGVVANAAGAAVLLAHAGKTSADAAKQVTQHLAHAGTKVLGVVFNRP
jgi:chain length determinant protein tyrosine kinase EpsG